MAIDFDALVPEDTVIQPKVVEGRQMEIPDRVLDWIRESYGSAKQVPVQASDCYQLCRMLLKGAERLDLGIKVRIVDRKGNEFVPNKDVYDQLEKSTAKMLVKFEAKERVRKQRRTKTEIQAETEPETASE